MCESPFPRATRHLHRLYWLSRSLVCDIIASMHVSPRERSICRENLRPTRTQRANDLELPAMPRLRLLMAPDGSLFLLPTATSGQLRESLSVELPTLRAVSAPRLRPLH